MKTYKFSFTKRAKKFINSRDKKERARILTAIYKLPYGTDILKMQRFDNRYRLRVGDVRIQYEIQDDVLVILILEADNRGDAY